jgi:hypothetical protein
MKPYLPTDDQIRTQFVTSLMNYFKIDEDVFLRSHIDELIRPIPASRYSEFLRLLSSGDFAYKTGVEKISLVAHELYEELRSPLEIEAHERTQKLAALMYDLRRQISETKDSEISASQRFENVRFTTIKHPDSSQPLLDSMDIEVVKLLTKKWIYDYVVNDRGLFEARVSHEYLILLTDQERNSKMSAISSSTQKALRR